MNGARELSTREVAEFLGMPSTWQVIRLIRAGKLQCERQRRQGPSRVAYYPTVLELRRYLEQYDPALIRRMPSTWWVRGNGPQRRATGRSLTSVKG